MNIREISVSRLRDYENNPRNNDLAVEKVKYSIERFGFLFPVVVDMNYTIVAGHTRVRACREMGIQTVPCIVADELTDEQINLFRLVDNKTSEYSDWDFEKLKEELSLVDLTLDENQLLLERFELTTEVFDIEPEQAEIKIPAFNFMGVNEKPKPKKSTVHTIDSNSVIREENDAVEDGDDEIGSTGGFVPRACELCRCPLLPLLRLPTAPPLPLRRVWFLLLMMVSLRKGTKAVLPVRSSALAMCRSSSLRWSLTA